MTEEKELSNLIAAMVRDPAFAKKVIANPAEFQEEYNLTPRNVKALKATSFDRLTEGAERAAGGCYYGG